MSARVLAASWCFCFLASAQQPPAPTAAELPPPPSEQTAPRPPEEPKPQPLVNTGAPIRLDYQCTEEDIRASGLACTADDPCPIYFEVSAVEQAGAKLFVVGNIHSSSATLFSVLLASEDTGKTWIEPYERLRFTLLEQIQFLDFESGWVSGQVVQPLPRDPFLLLTTDGGKTWKQRHVFGDDGRIGAVERFWFDSKTNGSLYVDRTQSGEPEAQHERYETMNGGESWMLREVSSQPLETKSARSVSWSGAWRVLADDETDSFRIEKRARDKWQTVASFSIPIGACAPPEKPAAAPPAEPGPVPDQPRVLPSTPSKPSGGPPSLKPKPNQ
jgi:hypothetical protein